MNRRPTKADTWRYSARQSNGIPFAAGRRAGASKGTRQRTARKHDAARGEEPPICGASLALLDAKLKEAA